MAVQSSRLQQRGGHDVSAASQSTALASTTAASRLLQQQGSGDPSPAGAGCAAMAATRQRYAAAMDNPALTPAQQAVLAQPDPFSSGMIAIASTLGSVALVTLLAGCAALRASKPPVLLQEGDGTSEAEVEEAAGEEIERKGCGGWAAFVFRELDQYDMDHP